MRNTLLPLTAAAALLWSDSASAQNIGINANGAAPHASALLDIDGSAVVGTKRGLLIPRVTAVEMNTIATPATALLVYNTTVGGFWFYDGAAWSPIFSNTTGWSLTGNAGTVAGTNFLGTVDNIPFELRVNNLRSGWVGAGPAFSAGANTSFGHQALPVATGHSNSAFGYQALQANTTGLSNSAVGLQALQANTTGGNNTAVGAITLQSNTTGTYNTALGSQSMISNTTGGQNAAIGSRALHSNTTGIQNTASGHEALYSNTTGNNNVAQGRGALAANTTGNNNTATGAYALNANTTASNSTAAGYEALRWNTTGSYNEGFGYHALFSNTTGWQNSAVGTFSMEMNTTGSYNTAAGHATLRSNTTGTDNVAVGRAALLSSTTASYNTSIGSQSMQFTTTGGNNSAFGYNALRANTTGSNNTAAGYGASWNNNAGGANSAFGYLALQQNTAGNSNNAFGYGALNWTTASENCAFGTQALLNNTTGGSNTAVGNTALVNSTTGGQNTAIGFQALGLNTTGSNNTMLGANADVLSGTLINATAIGHNAKVATSSSLVLGGTGASAVNVGIGTTSPTLAGLQVERMVGNTTLMAKAPGNSRGMAFIADSPGLYFNCYYNGTARAMANFGHPAIIEGNQSPDGGLRFYVTPTANTVADAPIAILEGMRINGAGNVGIGTGAPAFRLEVNGSAAKPGGGAWAVSSDARLKTDVKPFTDGLDLVSRIRPVTFRYNEASGHDTKPEYVGVIAQELEQVAPYMVGRFNRDGTDYLSVDNSAMVYMLVNAVQEQQTIIERLTQRLEELERR